MNDTAQALRETATQIAVLTNDTDPDDDALEIVRVGTPSSGGTVTHNGTTVTYTPRAGFLGTDTFTYTIEDSGGLTSTAQVTVTVEEPNRAPAAFDDSVANYGTTVTFNVITGEGTDNGTGNADVDPDGDPLTIDPISVDLAGSAGTLQCSSSGACTWTVQPGCDSFDVRLDYTLRDDRGASDIGELNLYADRAC